MDKPFLLTYSKGGIPNFAWFDTEEEMNEFIDENGVNVFEKLFIVHAEKID